ncbi:MAG: DUF58 domain-containing protein [Deltaproteobacteria bacterium]|nr:DUF58 domain-containing protein [Deltaproteobacteria bacterium]
MAINALDPTELARLSSMALRARVIVEGAFAGLHHNPSLGSATEFSEHKEYAPGDEIRRIDWKVVGRQDRYYVKRFEDETEMRTLLVVDGSASMGYGRHGVTKLMYAGFVTAALAYLLGRQGDPAGLMIHDRTMRRYLPPSGRGGHIREVLATLDTLQPGGETNLAAALERVADLAHRRSLVIVFSDLLDMAGSEAQRNAATATGPTALALSQLAARGHDVVLFHILDPDEIELPFDEVTQFLGMEPGDDRNVVVDAADLRASFAEESAAFRARWRQTCLQAGIEYRLVTTQEPLGGVLRSFIGGRGRTKL